MKRRVKFVQEAQKLGEVIVVYVQSAVNRADIFTKPVSAKIFDALRDAILNVRRTAAYKYPPVGMTHTPHSRHKINLISWMRATLSSPRAAQDRTPESSCAGPALDAVHARGDDSGVVYSGWAHARPENV